MAWGNEQKLGRKKLYTAALMAGLALPLALATPAQAHPVYAYHGADRAWTNTAHTRVGVEDRERDGHGVYAEYIIRGGTVRDVSDANGSAPGHGAEAAGGVVTQLRVCERNVSCGNWITVS